MKIQAFIFTIFVVTFLFVSKAFSQDYQTVNSGLNRYYKSNLLIQFENIQAVKIDSARTQFPGDSILYFYRIIRDTAQYGGSFGDCVLDTMAACWMGSHAIVKPNGENLFFNKSGDTIRFNTHASAGESWLFFKQPDYYLQATLNSVVFAKINGENDSVKIITLQAFNNSGFPVENWFNSKEFQISKNHGFDALYSFYDYPQDTSLYVSNSYVPLTHGAVFDFEPGDIFHFENGINYGGPPQYRIETILSKWFSSGNVTINYRKEVKLISNQLVWDPDPHIVTTIQTDTSIVSYGNLESLISELMPHEKFHISPFDISYHTLSANTQQWNGRSTITSDQSRMYDFNPGMGCYTGAFEPSYYYQSYTRGCGMSNTYNDYPSASFGYYIKLKYFKKGTEEWGNPYILTSTNELPKAEPLFEVFPNPFADCIEIHIENQTPAVVGLYIYSITGVLLAKIDETYKQPGTLIYNPDLSIFAKGVYVLMFKSGNQIRYKKIIRK